MIKNREFLKLGLVFGTIYFVQGMQNIPSLPVQYLIKNVLKLNEVDAQFFAAATSLAWLVKPLWGYISDTFPILGYRRKSYLLGMSLMASISWFLLAFFAYRHDYEYWGLLILFNISAAAYAFMDVVCDGLMVAKGKTSGLIDKFVNIQWFGMAVAGITVGFVSGYFSETANQNIDFYPVIFAVSGLIPLLTGFIVLFFTDEEKSRDVFPWLKFTLFCAAATLLGYLGMKFSADFYRLSMEIRILSGFIAFLLGSLLIWLWAGKPKMFWAMTLFLVCWFYSPSAGMASNYYKIDVLKFSESFRGMLGSLENFFGLLGILFYSFLLGKLPGLSRRFYLYFSIIVGAAGLGTQYFYYLAPGTQIFGIPINYYWVAILSGTLFSLLGAPGFLLPLAIAGDTAQEGKEAITYAWFMSIINFITTMSDFTGGLLYQKLQHTDLSYFAFIIGTGEFLGASANKVLILRLFVWISAAFTLLAIPVVFFTKLPDSRSVSKHKPL